MEEKYLELFEEEASEHIQNLERFLLDIEKNKENKDLIVDAKRSAHTIKGSARLLGLEDIGSVAHRMEDLFKAIEEGKVSIEKRTVDALLKGIDCVKAMLKGDNSMMKDTVDFLTSVIEGKPLETPGNSSPAQGEGKKKIAETRKGKKTTTKSRPKGKKPAEEKPVETPAGDNKKRKDEYFRVSSRKIENILNAASEILLEKIKHQGELLNVKKIPSLFAREAAERFPQLSKDDIKSIERYLDTRLKEALQGASESLDSLHAKIFELQYESLALKVVPFYLIIDELRRYVRDTASQLGKSVMFQVTGEEVEFDRSILDDLKPVIMHVINNSITHGLETVEERKSAGKPVDGNITINVFPRGQRIVIEILDDGRGINPQKLKDRALEKGVIDEFTYEEMSDEEALQLMYVHGLSTADRVTQISGRGVGMDVVLDTLNRIGGSINVQTEQGKFTRLALRFPRQRQ